MCIIQIQFRLNELAPILEFVSVWIDQCSLLASFQCARRQPKLPFMEHVREQQQLFGGRCCQVVGR